MTPLQAWVFAAAMRFANPDHHPQYPGHEETHDEAVTRYESIAADIATVAKNRSHAALLLALAIGESSLSSDADLGPCYRGATRSSPLRKRCDGGNAASIFQLHAFGGHSLADFFDDRKLAARVVLKLAVGSFKQCASLLPEDRLSGMGLGHCEAGNKSVEERYRLFKKLESWSPAP